jgi:hypothetical protein
VTESSVAWAQQQARLYLWHRHCVFMDSTTTWEFHRVSGRTTLWFLAPEWAHQLLDAVVTTWTEQPWHTEAFFLIPRVFQRDWGRASKHIQDLGLHAADIIPAYGGTTNIPCVLLHLPCYVRSLPQTRRMDIPSQPAGAEWHKEQAEYVRGLS